MAAYNNGSLSTSQVQELQTALNKADSNNKLSVDGKYGQFSSTAAGGLSAEDAYAKYVKNAGNSAATGNTAATGGNSAANTPTNGQTTANQTTTKITYKQPEIQPIEKYDISQMESQLQQWLEAAQKQQTGQIDYATQQGVKELERAEEDAQEQFQTQRNQIDIDEAKALDNQALYAEARGDKGGIGQAQYNTVQNTAAVNRLTVNKAQTKLSTDTARQIADLRAQGEFEKADALLSLTQNYLSQLMQLQQWGLNFNLSIDEFNASLKQWSAEFEMSQAELTGQYQGAPTWAAAQAEKELLADAGWALLDAGITPSAAQLEAMGLTPDQAKSLITAAKLARGGSGGGGGGGSGSGTGGGDHTSKYYDLYELVVGPGQYSAEQKYRSVNAYYEDGDLTDPEYYELVALIDSIGSTEDALENYALSDSTKKNHATNSLATVLNNRDKRVEAAQQATAKKENAQYQANHYASVLNARAGK